MTYERESDLAELVGKKIYHIFVEPDGGRIQFYTDAGNPITYRADGDCCSRTWVERVSNAEALIGQTVLKAECRNLPEPNPQPEKYECLAVYGEALYTDKGVCEIEYRNDSNGYYGGSLERDHYSTMGFNKRIAVTSEWVCNDAERQD